MIHILVIRDTKFWLVGPFENQNDALNFGRAHYSPGGPNGSRWQIIELPHTYYSAIGAVVYRPDIAATLSDNAVVGNFKV